MSLWKNALITPELALKQAKDDDEATAARIYASYVATLSAYRAVDFDDLIGCRLSCSAATSRCATNGSAVCVICWSMNIRTPIPASMNW
jgi:superfamily I DNA/RNA helicase